MSDASFALSSLVGHFLETPLDAGLIKDLLLDPASTPEDEPTAPAAATTLSNNAAAVAAATTTSTSSLSSSSPSPSPPPAVATTAPNTNDTDEVDLSKISSGAREILDKFGHKATAFAASLKTEVIARHPPAPPAQSRIYAAVTAYSASKSSSSAHLIDVEETDQSGSTALHYAVRLANTSLVNHLLEQKANPLIRDHFGYTCLDWCLYLDCGVDIARALITAAPHAVHDLNQWRSTPLFLAVRFSNLDTVQYVISAGASVHHRNIYGDTPLHYAADRCRLPIVKCLVEGANANVDVTNIYGVNPISELFESCQRYMVGTKAKAAAKSEITAWLADLLNKSTTTNSTAAAVSTTATSSPSS